MPGQSTSDRITRENAGALLRELLDFCEADPLALEVLRPELTRLSQLISQKEEESYLYKRGFLAAVEMVRDAEDRYGMGSMCSQWSGEDIAEDLLERAGIKQDEIENQPYDISPGPC